MAKILIVDDSAMSRRILRRILEGASHSVIEADDGMVAIEKYFLEKPDLVMLDLIMKGISGMEVLQKIKQMDQRARLVVASADIQNSTRVLTESEGAMGFVTKPFADKDIIAAVESALKEGRQ
jgi:two-component system, chemotaxis family, chemotaxis protein CheY